MTASINTVNQSVQQQLSGMTASMNTIKDTIAEFATTLDQAMINIGNLTSKVADIQLETTELRIVNQELQKKMETLQNRIQALDDAAANHDTIHHVKPGQDTAIMANINRLSEKIIMLEKKPAPLPTSYVQALNSGWDATPNGNSSTSTNSHKGKSAKPPPKPLQSLYPKAYREFQVSFGNAPTLEIDRVLEDKALEIVNDALVKSALQLRVFHGARFSLSKNMILSTSLYSTNENLAGYLVTIEEALQFIGPASAKLSAPWSKFLLHGVPTQMDMATVRRDVESYCHTVKLGQTPRWLAPEDKRKDKPASTIVLAFLGKVTFETLGGRVIIVGNRTCILSTYVQYGCQTQCTNCQGLGHPKEFCRAGSPRCAVCAGDHLTRNHQCPTGACRGGYQCLHQNLKCVNCLGPHRAANRNCPMKVKVSQEFRERIRQRVENRMD